MKAEDPSPQHHEVLVQDPLDHFQVAFPREPIHMTFNVPLENTQQVGHLNVYTTTVENEVLMMATIDSPLFNGKELEPQVFQNLLYSILIQRMFYEPKIFKDHYSFKSKLTSIDDNDALAFTVFFLDHGEPKKLAGTAISTGHKLHILLCLASEKNFEEAVWKHFLGSYKVIRLAKS